MRAKDIMAENVVCVGAADSVFDAADALHDLRGASFIGVLFLSAPGIALMALARWIDRRHYERRR